MVGSFIWGRVFSSVHGLPTRSIFLTRDGNGRHRRKNHAATTPAPPLFFCGVIQSGDVDHARHQKYFSFRTFQHNAGASHAAPSADTSARRPASKRGEDRTAGRAIGYAFITSTPATAPSSSFHPVPLFLFAHSPAKRRGGRECREVLPVPSDYGAQVQTVGTITAKPDGWRPIIKIIESHKNRVTSDNSITIIGSHPVTFSRYGADARRKNHAATVPRLCPLSLSRHACGVRPSIPPSLAGNGLRRAILGAG